MKQYEILSHSVTGIKGNQLTKGMIVNVGEIHDENIAELISGGFIKEAEAVSLEKPHLTGKLKKNDNETV